MPLTQLKNLEAYEISLVPKGANGKKRFLVVKEHGDLDMDKLLEQILKEDGLKDEEAVTKVAKSLDLSDDETKVLKAVLKMVGAESSPLSKEKLMKALNSMGGSTKKEMDTYQPPEKKEGACTPDSTTDSVKKEGDEPVKKETKGEGMPVKVPVKKEDGSWDLSGVDENLRPALEVVCKSNEELSKSLEQTTKENKTLADRLKEEKDARVLKEFEEKAKSYGHLGEEAVKLAKVLKAAHDADPENGKAIEQILKAANDKIEQGSLFEEKGTTGGMNAGASAWTKIEKSAEEIQKSDTKITKEDAINLVLKKNPKLYEEYQEEKRRAM